MVSVNIAILLSQVNVTNGAKLDWAILLSSDCGGGVFIPACMHACMHVCIIH